VNYRRAAPEELIDLLRDQERRPDLTLIRELLRRGDGIVPHLIEVLEVDRGWAAIHAGLLLCELQAESALPALQRAISASWGHDLADWLCNDALEKFGLAALDMLEAVAADRSVDWYPRAVACRVMRNIAFRHRETYDRVTAFLRRMLPAPNLDWRAYESYEALKEAVDDPQVWTSVVGRLCELRDPNAYDLIGQLFEAGLVDEMVMGPEHYREAYQKSGLPADLAERPMTLVERYERRQPRTTRTQKEPTQKTRKKRKRRKPR